MWNNPLFILQNELERALRVLSKMKQATAKPDIKTYELLFYLFGNVNHPYEKGNLLSQAVVAKRIKVIEADMAKNGVQHSSRSIRNLVTSSLLHAESSIGSIWMKKMIPLLSENRRSLKFQVK